jgi:hypothetical protein
VRHLTPSPLLRSAPQNRYTRVLFVTRPKSSPVALRNESCGSERRRGFGWRTDQSGQTLVALLAFMAMSIVLTSAATVVTLTNAQTSSKYSLGQEALRFAESGADNALQRLLRDPNYTGETLTVGTGTAIITVSGSGTKAAALDEKSKSLPPMRVTYSR